MDSSIVAKIDTIVKTVEKINSKPDTTIVSVCIAVLTAILFWVGQYLDRRAKRNQELYNTLLTTYHACQLSLFQMRTLFIKLASDRNTQKFWYCYKQIAISSKPHTAELIEKRKELIKQYGDDEKRVSIECIECQDKINDKFAEYYAYLMEFVTLANLPITASKIEKLFTDIDLKEAEENEETDYKECKKVYKDNKKALKELYDSYLFPFREINNKLHIETKNFYDNHFLMYGKSKKSSSTKKV